MGSLRASLLAIGLPRQSRSCRELARILEDRSSVAASTRAFAAATPASAAPDLTPSPIRDRRFLVLLAISEVAGVWMGFRPEVSPILPGLDPDRKSVV